MLQEETKKAIEIMQAYVDGKQIQHKRREYEMWLDIDCPSWNFQFSDYRIKPEPKLRPYASSEEFLKAQKVHGIYLKSKKDTDYYL